MRQGATYYLLETVAKALHQSQSQSYQLQHKMGESHQRIAGLGRRWCDSSALWMPFAGCHSRPREHPYLWGQTVVMHDMRTLNEPMIEVCKPKEWLHLFLGLGHRPFCNSCNFDWIHCDWPMCDYKSKVFDLCVLELHLSCHRKSLCSWSHSRTRHIMWWCSSMVLV